MSLHTLQAPSVLYLLLIIVSLSAAIGVFAGWRLRATARVRESLSDDCKSFFEQISDAALMTENGVIVAANPAASERFGYSRETIVGMPVTNLLADPEDESRFVRALLTEPVRDLELRLRTADNDIRDCLVTAAARFDDYGRMIGCRGLARDVTERNRMLAELRRAEHDYRGLFENAHDAILILDPADETVLDANQQACILYDLPREDFIGRSMVELSVDPRRGRTMIERTREGSGSFKTFESRHIRRDGTIIDVEINAAEVSYQSRRAILSINRDISARRAAEKAIRGSEERFRLLLESVTDYAVVMLDPHGEVVSWNVGAQRIMGYTESEIVGRSAAMFLPPEEERTLTELLIVAALSGRVERDMIRVRKDGSRFAASVTLTKIVDESGSLRGYAEITHDITERVQLERARQDMLGVLREVATEWTETFDAVQVPIVLLDRNGAIRRLNRAAQLLAGRGFTDLVGRRAADLPGEPWNTIADVARRAFARGAAATARAMQGDSVWQVSTSIGGVHPGDHRAIIVAYDLTLVTRLEASVRCNEVTAALGALVAGVAHEVRNPLFTISATLDAWEARYGQTEGVVRYARALREQVDRLNRLMRDLLDYGKPHALVIGAASPSDVIRGAAGSCAAIAEQHTTAIVLAADELPWIAIDCARVEQVLHNVIDNAIRHSPGGTVHVEAVIEENNVVFRVIDDGPGIGTQDAESMFRPFFTRRPGGTGLGLAIARRIVTAHRGEISLKNREDGHGAVAIIRLPLNEMPTEEAEVPMLAGMHAG